MMTALWSYNTPKHFWCCQNELTESQWEAACQNALPLLELSTPSDTIEALLALILGEAQFGPHHWRLSPLKRFYYALKPFLPRLLTCSLRRLHAAQARARFPLGWPIEARYVHFQWEVMRQLLLLTQKRTLTFRSFWPDGQPFALVLTHDIETQKGQDNVRAVADLEESLGFRSSFNFVPERYPLNQGLIRELKDRGFEVGVHGLNHDGKLFSSYTEFNKRAQRINQYIQSFDAAGFRAPFTHRNPEWMQLLDIAYDLSFFDTDPYEPLPGGSMSIWPYMMGRFVELPYTLPQDSTLLMVLGEKTPKIWLQKTEFIKKYHGMALVNTHPDYLKDGADWNIYKEFLQTMQEQKGYWHALPVEVAQWWRRRGQGTDKDPSPHIAQGVARLEGGTLFLEFT